MKLLHFLLVTFKKNHPNKELEEIYGEENKKIFVKIISNYIVYFAGKKPNKYWKIYDDEIEAMSFMIYNETGKTIQDIETEFIIKDLLE